jgi:hypothetical protein
MTAKTRSMEENFEIWSINCDFWWFNEHCCLRYRFQAIWKVWILAKIRNLLPTKGCTDIKRSWLRSKSLLNIHLELYFCQFWSNSSGDYNTNLLLYFYLFLYLSNKEGLYKQSVYFIPKSKHVPILLNLPCEGLLNWDFLEL